MNTTTTDRAAATRARVAVTLFFLISGFGFSTWASRIPTIQQRLGLSEAALGSVLLALPAGLMLTLPVTGLLLQRFSSRQVLLVGAVLYNVALALLGFAAHTWQLVLLLFCFGSSRNLLNISVNAQSVGVQALYPRAIIARFHGMWSVAGFAAAAVASGLVALGLGVAPGGHFLGVALLLTVLALAFYPGTLPLRPNTGGPARPGFVWPDRELLKFGLMAFTSMACEGTMYDWSAIYFAKAAHAPVGSVGFAVYMVAMTTGRFLGDALTNRLGIPTMLRGSGLLMTTGLLLAAAVPQPVVAGLGFALVGLGVACVVPLVFSMAGRSARLSGGPAIAAVSTVGYFGFLIVPPLVGFVAEAAGLRWAFALMATLGLALYALVSRLPQAEMPAPAAAGEPAPLGLE